MGQTIQFEVDDELYKRLQADATAKGMSLTQLVHEMLQAAMISTSDLSSRKWRRADRVVLTKSTAERARELGAKGEWLASRHLRDAGFGDVRNLNEEEKRNFPFADLSAELSGVRYFISVKARNRYQADGVTLNSSYKLGAKQRKLARLHTGVAAWIAVSFDIRRGKYSCYFGLLDELVGRHGIKMTAEATARYRCLAEDLKYPWDLTHLLNVPVRRAVG